MIAPQNYLLKKGFSNLVNQVAKFFSKFPELINKAIQVHLSTGNSIEFFKQNNKPCVNYVALEKIYVDALM